MNGFVDLSAASPAIDLWVAALLSITLKATAILLLATLAALALRRASAAARHLVWTLALSGLLLLPILSLVLPAWRVSAFSIGTGEPSAAVEETASLAAWVEESRVSPDAAPAVGGAADPREAVVSAAGPPVLSRAGRPGLAWPAWMLAAAGAGAALVLAWLLTGQWRVRRLTRRAEPVADPEWSGLVRDLSWMLDVDRSVQLLRSRAETMPMTWGALRPVILLPEESAEWPEERRRIVLLHELAHVARFDCLTQLIAQLACALFWFHPLAWYAAHRMRVERERACDDRVLGAGTRASSYAGHLLEVARTLRSSGFPSPATVSMARPSQLEGRLLAVLDPGRSRRVPGRAAAAIAFFATLGLVVPLAAVQPGQRGVALGDGEAILASSRILPPGEPAAPQPDFRWTGRIAPEGAIEVGGIIGDLNARTASGDVVEVTAVKRRGDHGDPRDVEIRVVEHDEGVTICAVYPNSPDDRPNDCRPGGNGQSVEDNDTRVDFTVHVPEGVRFIGRTVAGDIRAESLRSDLVAHTVAGDVTISTTGHAEASTVGGDIRASLGSTDWSDALRFRTVGGNITVQLPAEANVDVQAHSRAGGVSTEFPLDVRETGFVGERATGTIGSGGRRLTLETTGGNIRILRSGSPTAAVEPEAGSAVGSSASESTSWSVAESSSWEVSESDEDLEWVEPFVESMVDLGVEIGEGVSQIVAESMAEAVSDMTVEWDSEDVTVEWDSEWDEEIPEAAADALIELIGTDPDPEVRRYAAWALADVGQEAVPALSEAVRGDRSAEVREMAAWSLGQIEDPAAISALHAALRDRDEKVRFTAVWGLGEIGGDPAVPALAAALGDRDAEIRKRAAWTIGWIEPEAAPRDLIAALRDPDPGVREAAAWSLGNIRDPDALPALERALAGDDRGTRETIRWAVYSILESLSQGELTDATNSDNPEIRRLAVRAMSGDDLWPRPWPWPMRRPRPQP